MDSTRIGRCGDRGDLTKARCLTIRGMVQGVGFRPFIYRLAKELGLAGNVRNTSEGVRVVIEGSEHSLEAFDSKLRENPPPLSRIDAVEMNSLCADGARDFRILESQIMDAASPEIPADLATCASCLREMFDPGNRRYRYPFITCTDCGPRFSMIEGLPYDRNNTTMKTFRMCEACRNEYENPLDRRFHAQPIACAVCGPQLRWRLVNQKSHHFGEQAAYHAVEFLRGGQIIAVKALGGYHLMANALDPIAIERLRTRKGRPDKPLAALVTDLDTAMKYARVNEAEAALLESVQAPIVLLEPHKNSELACRIAPGFPSVGLFLPSNPLQHLLLSLFGGPLIATSGNRSGEPICYQDNQVESTLGDLIDGCLEHDRPITRPIDDSIVRILAGKPVILRGGRGYAPRSVGPSDKSPSSCDSVVAYGAHQKSTLSFFSRNRCIVSQHIGDLESQKSIEVHQKTLEDLQAILGIPRARVACDRHPDYLTTLLAHDTQQHPIQIQHHHAHIASCMQEHGLTGPVLGVAWDGTGFGTDGSVWGGEFLECTLAEFKRRAYLRPFFMPGGDRAAREPRRSAWALLNQLELSPGDMERIPTSSSFNARERLLLDRTMNCPGLTVKTSSMGRLFDGVASILGLCHVSTFEGQAAMYLEAICPPGVHTPYSIDVSNEVVDWRPWIGGILEDQKFGVSVSMISGRFHETLAQLIFQMARRTAELPAVLSGGCFQNRRLMDRTVGLLRANRLTVFFNQDVPPNDGGISVGQAAIAMSLLEERSKTCA